MTDNQTSIEDIYIGTKEVSENLKFESISLNDDLEYEMWAQSIKFIQSEFVLDIV